MICKQLPQFTGCPLICLWYFQLYFICIYKLYPCFPLQLLNLLRYVQRPSYYYKYFLKFCFFFTIIHYFFLPFSSFLCLKLQSTYNSLLGKEYDKKNIALCLYKWLGSCSNTLYCPAYLNEQKLHLNHILNPHKSISCSSILFH